MHDCGTIATGWLLLRTPCRTGGGDRKGGSVGLQHTVRQRFAIHIHVLCAANVRMHIQRTRCLKTSLEVLAIV